MYSIFSKFKGIKPFHDVKVFGDISNFIPTEFKYHIIWHIYDKYLQGICLYVRANYKYLKQIQSISNFEDYKIYIKYNNNKKITKLFDLNYVITTLYKIYDINNWTKIY